MERTVQLNSSCKDWKIAQWQVKWDQYSVCLCARASVHVFGCVPSPVSLYPRLLNSKAF